MALFLLSSAYCFCPAARVLQLRIQELFVGLLGDTTTSTAAEIE